MTAAAQVHATLATIPDPLEATLSRMADDVADHRHVAGPGDRVVLLAARPGRRPDRIVANDTLGTVLHYIGAVSEGDVSRVRVEWDDGIEQTEHPTTELGVVFCA